MSGKKTTVAAIPEPDKGFLYGVKSKVKLDFSVNPEALNRQEESAFNRSVSPGAPGAFVQYVGGGERTISFELIFEAIGGKAGDGGVLRELSILEAFTYPDADDLDNARFVSPPRALLGIGPRVWEGRVRRLDVKEEKFNARMEPVFVRAQVAFQIDDWENAANRRAHFQRRQALDR